MRTSVFQIFIPKKKRIFSANVFIVTSLILIICIESIMPHYFKSFYNKYEIHKYVMYYVYFVCSFSFIMAFLSYALKQTLNGHLSGKLEFHGEKIIINDRIFDMNIVISISIDARDFEGYVQDYRMNDINPRQSRGVNNILTIYLLSGEKVLVYFMQKHENELIQNKELLISYFEKGKIPFLKLMTLLKIDKYSEIQAFKAKHNH